MVEESSAEMKNRGLARPMVFAGAAFGLVMGISLFLIGRPLSMLVPMSLVHGPESFLPG